MTSPILVADSALDSLVLRFEHLVTNRISLDEILHIGIGKSGLPHQIDLLPDLLRLVQPLLDGFVDDQGLYDQLVDNGSSDVRAVRLTGIGTLLCDQVDTAFADGDTVYGCRNRFFCGRCRGFCLLVGITGAENQ